MAHEEFSQAELEQLRRVFQEAALNDFPNPDRIGCPTDKSVLKAMAARTLPLTDPVWRHAARCSPCFREIKDLEADSKRSRRWKAGAALGAIVLLAAILFVFRERAIPGARPAYQTVSL